MFNYITLAEAADDGARYAIVNSQAARSPIAGVVQSNAVGISPTPSVSFSYQDVSGHSAGAMVTVTATSGVTPLTGLFWKGMTITLQSKLAR